MVNYGEVKCLEGLMCTKTILFLMENYGDVKWLEGLMICANFCFL